MTTVIPSFGNGCDDSNYDYDEAERYGVDGRTCKICGVEGLDWIHTGVRWRLMEGMKFHTCKAPADAFEVEKPHDPD